MCLKKQKENRQFNKTKFLNATPFLCLTSIHVAVWPGIPQTPQWWLSDWVLLLMPHWSKRGTMYTLIAGKVSYIVYLEIYLVGSALYSHSRINAKPPIYKTSWQFNVRKSALLLILFLNLRGWIWSKTSGRGSSWVTRVWCCRWRRAILTMNLLLI